MKSRVLLDALLAGIVIFQYTKKSDGSTRTAVGTTKPELIPTLSEDKAAKLLEKSTAVTLACRSDDEGGVIEALEDLNTFLTAEPKQSSKAPNPDMVTYYDFEARGWRSFDFNNFVGATTPQSVKFTEGE